MKKNREIPSEIKRQLRQEAGFGCCICGIPIIEYHHINYQILKVAFVAFFKESNIETYIAHLDFAFL
jgi:hypothetical protein